MATITPNDDHESPKLAFMQIDISSHSSSSSSLSPDNSIDQLSESESINLSSDNSMDQLSESESDSKSLNESNIIILGSPVSDPDTSKSGSSSSLADSKYQLLYTNSKSKLLLDDESSDSNNSDSKHSSVNPQSPVSEQSNCSPQAGNLNIQPCEIINVEEFAPQSSDSEDINDDESFDHLYLQGIHLEQQLKQNVSANIATASIQDYIDFSLKLLRNDWIGKIIFPVYYGNNTIHRRNIVKYIGNPETWHNHPNFYFPIKTYDPKDKGFDSLGFLSLVKDLQRAAIQTGGFQLTKTGKTFSKGNLNGYYRLSCSRCQT